MKKLKEMYEINGGSFPDNREIVKAMKDIPEVQNYMKKLMPFIQNYKVCVKFNFISSTDATLLLLISCFFYSFNVFFIHSMFPLLGSMFSLLIQCFLY